MAAWQNVPQTAPDVRVSWSNVEPLLQDAHVDVRRKAAKYLANHGPEQQPAENLIRLDKIALADSDAEVKSLGVAAVHMHAWAQSDKAKGPKPRKLDFGQDEELYQTLLIAAGDESLEQVSRTGESIGWCAIMALGYLYWDHPDLEGKIIELYRKREGKARYEDVQVAVLTVIGNPLFASEQSREILLSALQADHASVQQTAAHVVGRLRPAGGLQALVDAYLATENKELRKRFLDAIVAFQDDATAMLPKLESDRAEAISRAEAIAKLMKFIQTRDYKVLDEKENGN